MKKIIYKGAYTRNEKKAFNRNGVLTDYADNMIIIMLASIAIKVIKGKLGFGSKTKDADFLTKSSAILSALLKDVGGYFTVPFAGLGLLEGQIKIFTGAITDAKNGGLGTSAAKDTAKTNLYGTLLSALAYINNLARLDNTNAVEIIEDAQMVVIGGKSHKKQDFAVKQGAASGQAMLRSRAVMIDGKYQIATYYWQYSIDGGVSWIDVPQTSKANTEIIDMKPGVPAKFRKQTFCAKTGLSIWCTALDFTVQ